MGRLPAVLTSFTRRHGWWCAAVAVTAFSLLLVLAPAVRAEQEPVALKDGAAQSQIYNDDLEVERGQVLEGDVVVYSGDVRIRPEGRIAGTLTVYSGDVEIDEGGRVDGNITSWSGDVQVDGRVGGSISAMAGDVEIGGAGSVGGDISVMAGDIKQRAGASVGGSVLRGPEFTLPAPPAIGALPWLAAPNAPAAPDAPGAVDRDGRWGGGWGFVGRALTALLLLALFVGGAAAVAALRPGWTADMHTVLNRQPALAFAAGLIANVLLLAVIGFLFITVCLRPPALLLGLGMLALNAAGMAAVGTEIGGRASERISGRWTPTARVALGVLLPGAIIAFLWTLGGCFGFFGFVGALLLGSFGVGSILVKALNLGAGPAAPMVPAGPGAPSSAAPAALAGAGAEAQPDAAPAAPAGAEAAGAAAEAETKAAAAPTAWWQEDATTDAQADAQPGPQPPVEPRAESPAPLLVPPATGDLAPMVQADFTRIEGIGPKLSQRLHAANIRTFADLAALPPETVGSILGWTSERVLRSGILDQAQRLATG